MLIIVIILAHLLAHNTGLRVIDLPDTNQQDSKELSEIKSLRRMNKEQQMLSEPTNAQELLQIWQMRRGDYNHAGENDANIKTKIATLVQQMLHDAERKMKYIQPLKESHRELAPYKIGFILSMIKKARDVLNELFNIAVKHRDQWRALEQLKVFELIVHTNVDTSNLVRQLVELHLEYMNGTETKV